jgi:hypothetical protein
MNAASVFARSAARAHVGGLIVFTDSQNRPYTHPRHHWLYQASTLDARLGLAPRSLKQSDSRAILE